MLFHLAASATEEPGVTLRRTPAQSLQALLTLNIYTVIEESSGPKEIGGSLHDRAGAVASEFGWLGSRDWLLVVDDMA